MNEKYAVTKVKIKGSHLTFRWDRDGLYLDKPKGEGMGEIWITHGELNAVLSAPRFVEKSHADVLVPLLEACRLKSVSRKGKKGK